MDITKEKIFVVIVEDDIDQQKMYEDSISEFNREQNEFEIAFKCLKNDSDIPKLLYESHIDAIIIDLNWGTGTQNDEGNRLVKKLYQDCRVPIFIVSGNLHLLDASYEESPVFKKYQRDVIDLNELFKEIVSLYKTGYTKVLGSNSKIDEMIRKVFWDHMAEVIHNWTDEDKETKTQRMLRFAITRINEMLTISTGDKHDNYDALEFYIKPPIKSSPFTGDIVTYNEKKYVVITAACDMEQDNSEYVVLGKINFDTIESLKSRIKSQSNTAEKELERYINNSKARYHLLPPCKYFSGGLIDFQNVLSVNHDDFFENSSVIASINPMFVKDIQARFSHYYGRQGQPQLNTERVTKWIKNS